jgi:predicted GNAT family N-acyltransferase
VHTTSVTFRPYRPSDAEDCLRVFDSNVPAFFALAERPGYAAFLAEMPCPYLVGEAPDGSVVACGGWFHAPERGEGVAGLAWGMVRRDWQHRGVGRQLLEARLAGVQATPGVHTLEISTSQHTEAFYAQAGFEVTARAADGHAPGIDRVDMRWRIRRTVRDARARDANRGALTR